MPFRALLCPTPLLPLGQRNPSMGAQSSARRPHGARSRAVVLRAGCQVVEGQEPRRPPAGRAPQQFPATVAAGLRRPRRAKRSAGGDRGVPRGLAAAPNGGFQVGARSGGLRASRERFCSRPAVSPRRGRPGVSTSAEGRSDSAGRSGLKSRGWGAVRTRMEKKGPFAVLWQKHICWGATPKNSAPWRKNGASGTLLVHV